jgi:hypothetical protein
METRFLRRKEGLFRLKINLEIIDFLKVPYYIVLRKQEGKNNIVIQKADT